MVEKKLNRVVVLAIHRHGKTRSLYIPKNIDKLIPEKASLIDVELIRVIG